MPLYKNIFLGAAVLLAANSFAADLFLEHKDVTRSSYYTGTPGSARAEPVSIDQWISAHGEDIDNLGIRDQGFVIEDAQLDTLVYGIANRLLAHWPGTAPPIAIFVQGDRSPLSYGAQTTYYGEIFIDYSVFIHAESEDELAAVIGHELAHILLEHGKSLKFKQNIEKSLETVDEARKLYAQAEALEYNEAAEKLSIDPSAEKKIKRSAMQKVMADRFYNTTHATVFSRGNEYDADRLALDLMVAAGYSPTGIKVSLERMAHAHNLSTQVSEYLVVSSQTTLDEAMGEVMAALEKSDASDLDQYFEDTGDKFMASALDFGKKTFENMASKSHPVPEKRVKQLTDYLYDNYPRSVRRRSPDIQSASSFKTGHIAALIGRYKVANQAIEAIGMGEFEIAQERSKAALAQPAGQHPYTRYVAFITDRNLNEHKSAVANIEKMNAQMQMPVFATTELAEFLADSGKYDQANDMMARYEDFYGTVAGFYPSRIIQSVAQSDQEKTTEFAQACYAATSPDSLLSTKCVQKSGISRPEDVQTPESEKPLGKLGGFFNDIGKK